MKDLLLASPLCALFLFSLLPLSLKLLRKQKEPLVFISSALALTGIFTALFLLFLVWPEEGPKHFFSGALISGPSQALCGVFLLLAGALTFLMSLQHPQVDKDKFSEILFLKMGALIGLLVLLWSGNMLTAFIGLELSSLSFYLLIALSRTGLEALKAGFKYFVLGSLAGAFLLYGISFVLASSGHFDLQKVFEQTPELLNRSRLFALGFVFILTGLWFKTSIFPFQFWLPDVYKGASTPLLVFMAVGLKLAVFVPLFEWTQGLFTKVDMPFLLSLFQWLAVLSVLFGNIIALLQKDFKKVLLFSTIAHSGYLFMILIASQTGFDMGRPALFYYLFLYMVMTAGVFICLRIFEKQDSAELKLSCLNSLSERHPLQAFFISLFLLSLAGLPPTGGFIAKVFVFQALIDQGFWWMLFWAILGSGIALFYYLKPIALMYMEKATLEKEQAFPRFLMPVVIALCCLVLLSGIAPSLFYFG